MPGIHEISVRALAEYACAEGNLIPAQASAQRLREGREGHAALQQQLGTSWQAEAAVRLDVALKGTVLRIQGRADALRVEDDRVELAEIKTTRKNPDAVGRNEHPVHWAQAEIYAALFMRISPRKYATVHLIYAGTEGGRREYTESYTAAEIEARLMRYATPYAEWVSVTDRWKEASTPTLQGLRFPFAEFRDGQREMSRYVYSAMVSGERTLIEAPTGIGKTAASLFGALKALGEGKITSIFYLTARTTGRQAAENALRLMRKTGLKLRSVTITAKEKACILPKKDCGICPYADGYFDRRREVLRKAMLMEDFCPAEVARMAEENELCPFELSLDLSEIADVVICDYNYVFDPRVRLKRHFERKSRAGLLIDEAHNLPDRAREMYSAALSGERLETQMAQCAQIFGMEDGLRKPAMALLSHFRREDAEYECLSELPAGMAECAEILGTLMEKMQVGEETTVEMMRELNWFARVARQFDDQAYRVLIRPEGQGHIEVRLWCFSPERYLDRLFSRVGGTALFSATLTPIDHYALLLAVPDRRSWLTLASPFPPENLLTARMPVSVRFRDREDTLEKVTRILHAMTQAHPGNYMACFPSHAYLNQAWQYYRIRYPDEQLVRQEPGMSERRRSEFIDRFRPAPQRSLLAFIVLGGVFAEGVDLPDDRLSGAAVISTGIPQVNPELELLREMYDDGMEGGYDTAYTYPGFRRVLQAAGRVIRTETDRGVVLLIDERYSAEKYANLMPEHWNVKKITSMSVLNRKLKEFWAADLPKSIEN